MSAAASDDRVVAAEEVSLVPARSALSPRATALAYLVAVSSDAISIWAQLAPPVQWAVDGATAIALFAIVGFRWRLLPVLAVEAIPGLATLPTWILVVISLTAFEARKPRPR